MADFAVFQAEDLVAAANSDIELLVTSQLQYTEGIYFHFFDQNKKPLFF